MIGIKAVASYVPDGRVDNLLRAERAGKTRDFVETKIGFKSVARKPDNMETSDLCVEAYNVLIDKTGSGGPDVDCMVVCTQNPDGAGLPHTAAIVHGKLGLSDTVAAFDISLGCSGYVYCLSVISSFMEANKLQRGLLFTADPYSKVLDPSDFDTELLFGDAATVTLLEHSPIFNLGRFAFGSRGAMGHSIEVGAGDRKLRMKGSNVFKFSMTTVPDQIRHCLAINSLRAEEVDLFLLHQGSKFIVDSLGSRLGIPADKAPFSASEVGNTVSSSIPLMLEHYVESDVDTIMICGFGVGLSWASGILRRH